MFFVFFFFSTMDHCKKFIKAEFPLIDIEMFQYIEGKIEDSTDSRIDHCATIHVCCTMILGVLENGIEDFHDTEDIYEAIGEVLQEIANKSEADIR